MDNGTYDAGVCEYEPFLISDIRQFGADGERVHGAYGYRCAKADGASNVLRSS